MTVISAVLRELMAAGLEGDALLAAVERIEAAGDSGGIRVESTLEKRRSWDREYRRNNKINPPDSTRIPPDPPENAETPLLLIEDKNLKKVIKVGRATRIPPDWELIEVDRQFALDRGMLATRISTESEKFKNYWTAKSGQSATSPNWSAKWRTWVQNSIERTGIAAPVPAKSTDQPAYMKPPPGCETAEEIRAKFNGAKNVHAKNSEIRGDTAVGEGGGNDAPQLRLSG